ncbi:hypothetical protein [Oceanisphaera sp. KMM 10153]|uniref:hypothetical protein n=1 Tax=Oceanisphaera submarina TaxID=3390193 RepID=UPI003974D5A5
MNELKPDDPAFYYFVDDLPGAHIPATRIRKIFERLQQGKSLSDFTLGYLKNQGLEALYLHLTGCSTVDEFQKAARAEQVKRQQAALESRIARETEEQARDIARQARVKLATEQAEAAHRAREQDPRYIAKLKNKKLRDRYDLDIFIEEDFFAQLMSILRRVDTGKRLTDADILWLSTEAEEYYTDALCSAFHELEAVFYAEEFKKTQDPWMAVNASSHYRKCNQARAAETLLSPIKVDQLKSSKLKSALCTTHGGVKRDLERWNDAISLGEQAHGFMEMDFRPCTLLGAVYMEMGSYDLGQRCSGSMIPDTI